MFAASQKLDQSWHSHSFQHTLRDNRRKVAATDDAGPWVLLAAGLSGDNVTETIADGRGFSFAKITSMSDPMFLPGALKYGGLPALAAPHKLAVAGMKGISEDERKPLTAVYLAAGGQLVLEEERLPPEAVVEKLLRTSK